MNSPEQVFQILDSAITKAKAEGLTLVYQGFGNKVTCCCAISALPSFVPNNIIETANALEITFSNIWDILAGFDQELPEDAKEGQFCQIGRALHEKYKPIKYTDFILTQKESIA